MHVARVADSWVCAGEDSPNHLASQSNEQEPGQGVEPGFLNVCKHLMKGSCRFGLNCRFSHDVNPSGASDEGSSLVVVPSRSSKPWPRQEGRSWVHIFLKRNHPEFELVPMLIGHGGQCTRGIALSTGSKIRIRGRGSGHLEVDGMKEAPVPLMISISVPKSSSGGLRSAVKQTIELLLATAQSFKLFCQARGLSSELYDLPLFSFGEVSKGSESVLRDLMGQFPMTPVDVSKKVVTPGGVTARDVARLSGPAPACASLLSPALTPSCSRSSASRCLNSSAVAFQPVSSCAAVSSEPWDMPYRYCSTTFSGCCSCGDEELWDMSVGSWYLPTSGSFGHDTAGFPCAADSLEYYDPAGPCEQWQAWQLQSYHEHEASLHWPLSECVLDVVQPCSLSCSSAPAVEDPVQLISTSDVLVHDPDGLAALIRQATFAYLTDGDLDSCQADCV